MSASMYNLCCRYRGKEVVLRHRNGRTYRGTIVNVDRRNVYVRPAGGRRGYGYGYWGRGLLAFSLGAIVGIGIAGLWFW